MTRWIRNGWIQRLIGVLVFLGLVVGGVMQGIGAMTAPRYSLFPTG